MRSCFDCMLHVFILHVFDRDAVDFPLLPGANRFCGCFRLGSGPVLFWCFPAFCFAFSAGETQVWLGDLRVVALVWLLVLCFASIDLLISRTVRPCTDVFAAYSHVRTEPLARHRPNSREKKIGISERFSVSRWVSTFVLNNRA